MNEIKMLDFSQEYLSLYEEINTTLDEVLNSGRYIKGDQVDILEAELYSYMDNTFALTCGNGTDALQIALIALDLKKGDEVITTPFTFVSTVEVIMLLKLKPVFVDINPFDYTIDVTKIERAITERTKVILPVHLFGACSNMTAIDNIAKRNNLFVIEDACQAMGTVYNKFYRWNESKKAGTIGNIGCTSFFPTKNLGCYGDGGAIFTKDNALYEKMAMIANHGSKNKYYYDMVGVNSRLDELQAAILNVKLRYLDKIINLKQKVAEIYYNELSDIQFQGEKLKHATSVIPNEEKIVLPVISDRYKHTYHQFTIRLKKRDDLKTFLSLNGIQSMIYYPVPLHLQKAYKSLGYKEGDFPVSEQVSQEVLSLPVHPFLTEDQVKYITATIKKFLET